MVGWHAGFDPPSPQGSTGAIGVPLFRKRGSAVAGDPGGWPLGSGRPEGSGAGGAEALLGATIPEFIPNYGVEKGDFLDVELSADASGQTSVA